MKVEVGEITYLKSYYTRYHLYEVRLRCNLWEEAVPIEIMVSHEFQHITEHSILRKWAIEQAVTQGLLPQELLIKEIKDV